MKQPRITGNIFWEVNFSVFAKYKLSLKISTFAEIECHEECDQLDSRFIYSCISSKQLPEYFR